MSQKVVNRKTAKNKQADFINKTVDYISAAFFVIIAALYPLFLSPMGKYVGLTSTKAFFFALIAVAAAALIFVILLTMTKAMRPEHYFIENEPRRCLTAPEWLLIAYIALVAVSALLSKYPKIAWEGYNERDEGAITIICYALTYWIVSRFYKPRALHFALFAVSGLFISAYAVLQVLGADIFGLFPFQAKQFLDAAGNPVFGRLSAFFRTTLGNVDILSGYSSLAAVFFAAMYCGDNPGRKQWRRYIYLAASALTFLMLILSVTDAGKVGILGAMTLLIPYWLSDKARLGRIMITLSTWCFAYSAYHAYMGALKKTADLALFPPHDQNFLTNYAPRGVAPFIALGVVLLAAGVCLPYLTKKLDWPQKLIGRASVALLCLTIIGGLSFVYVAGPRWADQSRNRIYELSQIMRGNFDDNFGSNRGWVYKAGYKAIWNNPVFGTGPDTFYYALSPESQKESQTRFGSNFDEAHSSFLQIAVCTGVPALLAYLAFVFGLFGMSLKKAFNNPLLFAGLGGALSYFIQSQLGVSVPIVTPLMWALFGLIAGEVWRMKIKEAR